MGSKNNSSAKFRFIDFIVILLCLSGAVYSINLFRNDLFQTINAQNAAPIGIVSSKRNTVQRRMSDRVLWDRLLNQSSVYSNDTIRVAELSEASLDISGHGIILNENTLIRIMIDKDTGQLKIELSSGNMDIITSKKGESVVLNVMGREVEAAPGAALKAAVRNDGMAIQINEGAVKINENGRSRELIAPSLIAMNSEGSVRQDPAVVTLLPRANARYIKTGSGPVNVDFTWNRVNMGANETLRLEIAEDQNFNSIVHSAGNLNSTAVMALNTGVWNWRLNYNGAVLSIGRISVVDVSGPQLLSPSLNEQFNYETELPKLYFQWTEMEDVLHYILEVDVTPEFRNPIIKEQTEVTFFTASSLDKGIWYWRVVPIFNYEGAVANPRTSSFRIVNGNETPPPVIEEPKVTPAPTPAPVKPPAPVRPPARVRLEVPAQDASVQGLTALQQQTIFRWSSEEAVGKSRFVLSRNSNPLASPELEINDPNRTVRVDRLEEGLWYWTVEARTLKGENISAQNPRRLRVSPVPLLPAPANRQPEAGYSAGIEDLKNRIINFTWSPVSGANAYIFTLYRVTGSERSLIVQIEPLNGTSWSTEVKTLGRGNYLWRIEAVNIGSNRVINQRGNPAENTFIIDIPQPGRIQMIDDEEESYD